MTTRVQDLAQALLGGLIGFVVESRVEAGSAFIAASNGGLDISIDIYWGCGEALHACVVSYRGDRLASESTFRDPLTSSLLAVARDLLTPELARS